MDNKFTKKIPLNPPLPKGEATKKDSGQAGMTIAEVLFAKCIVCISQGKPNE